MISFATNLYLLIKNPIHYITTSIEQKKAYLINFAFFLIFVVAACLYISFLNSSQLGSTLSYFTYIIFMIFSGLLFFYSIFIDSAITGFFLKNRNVTPFPFGNKQVFILITLSYFPYLLLPAASLLSLSLGLGFYILFSIISFLFMLIIRYQFLKRYIQFFNIPTFFLTIFPTVLQVIFGLLTLFFLGSAYLLIIVKYAQSFLNKALESGAF